MDLVSHSFDALMTPLEASSLRVRREALIGRAAGRILEVGAGTGANLPHYRDEQLEEITITDVNLRPAILVRADGRPTPVRFRQSGVEDLPFEDDSFDMVISTLVFCSVEDPEEGMRQLRRVLKPGGKFYFIEHILPEYGPARPIFNAVTPVWKHIAGGCHLNRPTVHTIREAGFLIEEMHYFANGAFVEGIAENPANSPAEPAAPAPRRS